MAELKIKLKGVEEFLESFSTKCDEVAEIFKQMEDKKSDQVVEYDMDDKVLMSQILQRLAYSDLMTNEILKIEYKKFGWPFKKGSYVLDDEEN